jgi:hypothetical protein
MRGNGQDPGDVCVVEHARHPSWRNARERRMTAPGPAVRLRPA